MEQSQFGRLVAPVKALVVYFTTALVVALGGRIVDMVEAETEAAAGAAV